jgi:ssDNA-binding Zn-finger/Zn-ribbon topoisomerase 1
MILRDGASGLFLACSAFPKCRNTMNVSVHLLRTLKDKLDPKFHPLTEAPAACPECQAAVILRWSRKTKKNLFTCENSLEKKCKWLQELSEE